MGDGHFLMAGLALFLTGIGMYWMSDPPLWGHALVATVAGGVFIILFDRRFHDDG